MIWLAWRQLRASVTAAAGALALLAIVLAVSGPQLRDSYERSLGNCRTYRGTACSIIAQQFFADHQSLFLAVTALVIAIPALLGAFWGAPLVTRELENGTHSLAWSQSISRTRWLAVKLAFTGVAAMSVAALGSLVVTWWSAPLDNVAATGEFPKMEPVLFAGRGVVPIGYAAFAFTTGVAVGLLTRRVLPAMTIALAVFVLAQVAVPMFVRPHLVAPVTADLEISDEPLDGFKVARIGPDRITIDSGDSGAWMLSSRTLDAAGDAVSAMDLDPDGPCVSRNQDREACFAEMTERGYRLEAVYHPSSHFWPLQWIEASIYLAAAIGAGAFCFWRIRRLN